MDIVYDKTGSVIDKLAEECAEVIQICMKINRFGIDSYHPVSKLTNSALLTSEIIDLQRRLNETREWLKNLKKEAGD